MPTDILSEGLRITFMNADLSLWCFSGASGLPAELSVGFVESLMSSEKFREIESGDSEILLSRRPILFKHSCLQTGQQDRQFRFPELYRREHYDEEHIIGVARRPPLKDDTNFKNAFVTPRPVMVLGEH